jgi:predicted metal-dependent hydrolase
MVTGKLQVDGTSGIPYELIHKKIKHIYFRPREGVIQITAPSWVSSEEARRLLEKRIPWATAALERAPALRRLFLDEPSQGDLFYQGGEPLEVFLEACDRDEIQVAGNRLHIRSREETNPRELGKRLHKWVRGECARLFAALDEEIYPLFADSSVPRADIRPRRMVSRWGTCHGSKGRIWLNTALLGVPRPCAAYILAHEYAHFLVPNHSPLFYSTVEKRVPDWQQRREELKQYSLR